jgi:iron complex outermembrane receptor protein
MKELRYLKSVLIGGASVLTLVHPAAAKVFDIPDGDLASALVAYMKQSDVELVYVDNVVRGHKSRGARGDYTETGALAQILRGSGFVAQTMPSNTIGIVPQQQPKPKPVEELAQVTRRALGVPMPAASASSIETVVVTAQKKSENIQQVPIAVSAFTQQELTERQVAGGPDLVKEVPNLTFTKTNFTGYNLQIRGIGTQAISVTTDPAVAVAFNDIPFIRNHFFEQEFFDVADVEVLRGPQGTLFGRNATAGVVNIKSAPPTDQYEAILSADFGNYDNQRLEGMLNVPVVSDKLDIRMAGEWTKRTGYTEDQELDTSVDGRDLWSGRLTIGFNPTENFKSDFIWEHFSEDDDRMRSAKQLCEKDPGPTSVGGVDLLTLPNLGGDGGPGQTQAFFTDYARTWLSQGCLPTSLYSPSAYETPNGQTLPFVALGEFLYGTGSGSNGAILNQVDPYASQTQPMNLRVIQSLILPHYRAKNDTLEYNTNFAITPELTLISETGYNNDFLFSTEDFNRFDTRPGIFSEGITGAGDPDQPSAVGPNGVYCDPQVGCSSSMVAEDLSQEHASQFNQEIRLESNFQGPLNFSFGTNYTHYQTVEDYYVFFNLLTAETQGTNGSGPGQYTICNPGDILQDNGSGNLLPKFEIPAQQPFIYASAEWPSVFGCGGHDTLGPYGFTGTYIDPNPIGSLDGQGHNYFRSENPYALNSWAGFGEVYYDVTQDLKLTGGLRWTDDRKFFTDIPSQTFEMGGGYPVAGYVKQNWDEWTGRFNASWSPKLDFTDQSMVYASYAHGYKGGGANPPGPTTDELSSQSYATHPATFAPEHIEAFEVGAKNTALDGTLTFDGDIFFYNYHGYQISQIVDRTSINLNFNATVEGAELESTWEPLPGLKFNLAGGYEDSAVDKNQYAIDLMDRTAGMPGWVVVRPYPTETSNCILPAAAVAQIFQVLTYPSLFGQGIDGACDAAYNPNHGFAAVFSGLDQAAFAAAGFNPATAPNGGEGFAKNLSGNKLPNAPPFTLSTGGQYSMPVSDDWAATFRADFYWQGNQYARIFNDKPYDSIHGYTNLNLALMLDSQNGWDVMLYVKNVFDVTAITGDFLNSDDSALTTNVFVTDPRLFGVRVTKHLDEGEGFWGSEWSGADIFKDIFSDADGGRPPLWIELGGNFDQLTDGSQLFTPSFLPKIPGNLGSPVPVEKPLGLGLDWETKITYEPDDTDWVVMASIRYGRVSKNEHVHNQTKPIGTGKYEQYNFPARYQDTEAQNSEMHEILDFMVGKNVGLGMLNPPGASTISAGVRYAEFSSRTNIAIGADPDSVDIPTAVPRYHFHKFDGTFDATRNFRGLGPEIAADSSSPFAGNAQEGQFTFDWGANGAVLFGRKTALGTHSTAGGYYCQNGHGGFAGQTGCPAQTHYHLPYLYNGGHVNISHYQRTKPFNRSRMVVVPNIGAFAGISYRLPNAKLSFGYRADEFFGAMDGGIDTYKSYDRGFFGPFASISIGLGG